LPAWDYRWVIFSVVYLAVRRLLGCLMVLAQRQVSKDAELLVLRHENAVLRRQIGRVLYQPGDRLRLAVLSRLPSLEPGRLSCPVPCGGPSTPTMSRPHKQSLTGSCPTCP